MSESTRTTDSVLLAQNNRTSAGARRVVLQLTYEICFCCLGHIKVDDYVHGLDIHTSGQEIYPITIQEIHTLISYTLQANLPLNAALTGTDQIPAHPSPKVVEHPITVRLQHLGVGEEARVSEFGDLLGEEFYSVGRVAEDHGLVDLKLQMRVRQNYKAGHVSNELLR